MGVIGMVLDSGLRRSAIGRRAAAAAIGFLALLVCGASRAVQTPDDNSGALPARVASGAAISLGDDTIDPVQPIRPDFVINVAVAGEPDPSGNYKVDTKGDITIRYAGAVSAVSVKNMSPQQAQDAIAAFLKRYIKNPVVKVTIADVPRMSIFIGGAVRHTGQVIINPDSTLLDVITRVEYTDAADLSQVKIIRKDKSDPIYVDFDKYIRSKRGEKIDESFNPLLKDKDRILVATRTAPGALGTISVFGEVAHPTTAVQVRPSSPLTVREVVNLAGGATATADRHRVTVRRAGVDRPLIVDLDKAEQGDLVNNIELKPDDTVYVEKLENNAYINVNGGLVRPGRQVYDKRTTLTQAIAEAGGPAPYARTKKGYIQRHPDNDPKHTRTITFNYSDILAGKAQDIELEAGDGVFIEPGGAPRPGLGPLDWLSAIGSVSSAYYFLRR